MLKKWAVEYFFYFGGVIDVRCERGGLLKI